MVDAFASAGSQKWMQIAVNRYPEVLDDALRRAGAISAKSNVSWGSPLAKDGFREYRDASALKRVGLSGLRGTTLEQFWPNRGPVWDAIGSINPDGSPIFVEAKAHIPEAASPPCRAQPESLKHIIASLTETRSIYAPRASGEWHGLFYQYANRLAFQYLLRRLNGIPSALVFLYFLNDKQMKGPASEAEWQGAIRLIHGCLGLPANLERHGVFDAFVDVCNLNSDRNR